jgi:hypothetical protein
VAVALYVASGCGCYRTNSGVKTRNIQTATFIEKNFDRLGRRAKIGATKENLKGVLPPMQNNDTEKVWVWVDSSELNPGEDRAWRDLIAGKGGYFVVFREGRLVTPICSCAAFVDPRHALETFANLSQAEAEEFLRK